VRLHPKDSVDLIAGCQSVCPQWKLLPSGGVWNLEFEHRWGHLTLKDASPQLGFQDSYLDFAESSANSVLSKHLLWGGKKLTQRQFNHTMWVLSSIPKKCICVFFIWTISLPQKCHPQALYIETACHICAPGDDKFPTTFSQLVRINLLTS
jgi:hypothetical protein